MSQRKELPIKHPGIEPEFFRDSQAITCKETQLVFGVDATKALAMFLAKNEDFLTFREGSRPFLTLPRF